MLQNMTKGFVRNFSMYHLVKTMGKVQPMPVITASDFAFSGTFKVSGRFSLIILSIGFRLESDEVEYPETQARGKGVLLWQPLHRPHVLGRLDQSQRLGESKNRALRTNAHPHYGNCSALRCLLLPGSQHCSKRSHRSATNIQT